MTCILDRAIYWLILTWWLTQQVAGQANLDMAYDAFDDQYEGCTEEMEKNAPQLLKEELEANKYLKDEWEKAKERWKEIKNTSSSSKQLNDFHGTAIVAYTGDIYTEFNKAVREFLKNPQDFQFKAFHYFLTRAIQILHTGECYTVYRGCKTRFHYNGLGDVRFGQFASSSTSKKVALQFADKEGTMFTIRTCLGVKIDNYSYYKYEKEVLIPGYEIYQNIGLKNENEIKLENPIKGKSNFNCFYYNSMNNHSGQDNFNSSGMKRPALSLLMPGLLLWLVLCVL